MALLIVAIKIAAMLVELGCLCLIGWFTVTVWRETRSLWVRVGFTAVMVGIMLLILVGVIVTWILQ